MSSPNLFRTFLPLGFLLLLLAARGACAQEPQEPPPAEDPSQQPNPPKPAGRGLPGMNDDQTTDQENNNDWHPDTTPVTGLQAPTLGSPSLRHSYWAPGAQYGLMLQSNPFGGQNSGWFATNYIGGTLSLYKESSGATLGLNYSGGGTVVSGGAQQTGQGNGWYQQLQAGQSFRFHRWSWQWSDQFSYLPETQFGFGAGTELALPGVSGSLAPVIGGGLPPNQSILSAVGPRYSNSLVLQGTYILSRRHSVTIAGTAGLLHYTQVQDANSNNYLGSIGYNYALTKEDSIGVSYRFGSYHFPNQPQAYGDTSVGMSYQRRITQRLALQAFVGPDFISYRLPIGGSTKQTSVAVNSTLSYSFKQAGVAASYTHGLSGGSGVLVGGELDQLTFTGNRRISRLWTANGTFGFARNATLSNAGPSLGLPSYDNYLAGAGATRPIGRRVNLAVSYSALIQKASQTSACAGTGCSANTTQHSVNVSLNWHARPFVLE
jgi:hypothetical protein